MRKHICLLLSLFLATALAMPASADDAPGENPTVPQPTACVHEYGEGSVTSAPNCGQAGIKTFTCSKCGATKTESIAVTGEHSWNSGSVTTAPTCQSEGLRTFTCTVCNGTRTEPIAVNPSAHAFGSWDAGQSGTHTRICGCGAQESGAHSFSITATIPATCKEEGATANGCSVCGRIEYTVIPKLTTHTYDNDCDAECNVCGFTRDAAHHFTTSWSKNASGHWHVCLKCGQKDAVKNHYAGPAATEEKDQLCLTCGYLLTPKLGHTHKYETGFTSDETGHWHACSGCADQKDFSQHVYDNSCDTGCNVCGYETATAHTTDGTWNSDETGHWQICSVCGEFTQYAEHIPDEQASAQCGICGYALPVPSESHTHEGGSWLSDEESHWKACACGEILEKAPHSWENDKRGHSSCAICGAENGGTVSAAPAGIPMTAVLIGLIVLALTGAVVCILLLVLPKKPKGKFAK